MRYMFSALRNVGTVSCIGGANVSVENSHSCVFVVTLNRETDCPLWTTPCDPLTLKFAIPSASGEKVNLFSANAPDSAYQEFPIVKTSNQPALAVASAYP